MIYTLNQSATNSPFSLTAHLPPFAWLAVWVLSPDWLCRKLGVCNFYPGA